MKISYMQTSPVFGDIKKNVEAAVKKIKTLDTDLVVLPELFSTGYQFLSRKEALKYSEDARGGYAAKRLMETAKETGSYIVAGMAEKDGERAYNSSILVGPKGFIGLYRKAHLFWDETKIFTPGNTPFEVHDIGAAKVGMMICFDWVFPEAARTLALKGADIICQPSNLVLPYCPQAMITRSLENRVFSITANRAGSEERKAGKKVRFIGQSQFVTPRGEVLKRAGTRPEANTVDIDPREARKKKITPCNDIFRDRRKDLFCLD